MRRTVTDIGTHSGVEPAELIFLHTAPVHVQSFEMLLRELRPHTRARHVVREDLLSAAQREGIQSPAVRDAVTDAVTGLEAAPGAVVLCTCSTIGGLAESAAAVTGTKVIRVDRAMAERAVAAGPRIVVAAAATSTLAPTESLILEAASRAGASVRITPLVVEGAWPLFEQGELEAYLTRIADALNTATDCDVIVLAQASMAGAVERCRELSVPLLSSPRLGLESALAALARDTG